MFEIAICERFHWTLDYLRDINMSDFKGITKYLKKMESENKKATRKSKRRGR